MTKKKIWNSILLRCSISVSVSKFLYFMYSPTAIKKNMGMTAFTATIKLSIGSFQKNIFLILNILVLLIIQQSRLLSKLYLLRFTCCKCALKSWDVAEFFTTKPRLYARWNATTAKKLTTGSGTSRERCGLVYPHPGCFSL